MWAGHFRGSQVAIKTLRVDTEGSLSMHSRTNKSQTRSKLADKRRKASAKIAQQDRAARKTSGANQSMYTASRTAFSNDASASEEHPESSTQLVRTLQGVMVRTGQVAATAPNSKPSMDPERTASDRRAMIKNMKDFLAEINILVKLRSPYIVMFLG